MALGLTLTPGSYGYDIVNEDLEACATLTSAGGSALTSVDLVSVPEEQSVDGRTGDLFLGSIHGMDAQVILRGGAMTGVPARVSAERRRDARGGEYASVKLALRIDPASIPRERVADGARAHLEPMGNTFRAVTDTRQPSNDSAQMV